MLRWMMGLPGVGLELARMAARGALNARNRYWQWRQQTAFGHSSISRSEKARQILEHARWVQAMRRFR